MRIKPKVICHIGFLICFFVELVSLGILLLSNGGACEQSARLSHSVNITSTIFVLLLDLIFASLILKCDSSVEVDPSAVIVNAWSSLVCTGAGLSMIFVVLYYCNGSADIILLGGILMIMSGVIHLLNAIYAYNKA